MCRMMFSEHRIKAPCHSSSSFTHLQCWQLQTSWRRVIWLLQTVLEVQPAEDWQDDCGLNVGGRGRSQTGESVEANAVNQQGKLNVSNPAVSLDKMCSVADKKKTNMYMSNKSFCEALFESFQMVTFWIFYFPNSAHSPKHKVI